jgi:hypothetical protein
LLVALVVTAGVGLVGAGGLGAAVVRTTGSVVARRPLAGVATGAAVAVVSGGAIGIGTVVDPESGTVVDPESGTVVEVDGVLASLHTSSDVELGALVEGRRTRSAAVGSSLVLVRRATSRLTLRTVARPTTPPTTRLRRWRACRRSLRVSGDMATQPRRRSPPIGHHAPDVADHG